MFLVHGKEHSLHHDSLTKRPVFIIDDPWSISYIKIEVTLDSDKITIGTVGKEFAAIVFSRTVTGNGNNAQGTWKNH